MIKLAVSGKLGSGKDLFLSTAQTQFKNLDFKNEKFAQILYDIVGGVQDKLSLPITKDGKMLQFIGQHYRDMYLNIWVDRFFELTHNPERNVIVTDLRYPNELQACKDNGFKTVRILRQDELRLNNLGNRDIHHTSETALDYTPLGDYDYVINNNGSLEFFESAVISVIKDIMRKQ